MTTFAARVELTERDASDDQIARLVDALDEHGASAGRSDSGALAVHLTVEADDDGEPAAAVAARMVAAACDQAELPATIRGLELRTEAEQDAERTRTWAAHVEFDRRELTDVQVDLLADRLEAFHPSVGINGYGYATVQLDVDATHLGHAADRAAALVLGAARDIGLGKVSLVQLELLADPEELERRSAMPPEPWTPVLVAKKAAAEQLGVSAQQMNRYAGDGHFGAQRIGSEWVFPQVLIDQEGRRRASEGSGRGRVSAPSRP